MKILQINAVGQYGSTGRNCQELKEFVNTKTEHRCYNVFAKGMTDVCSRRIGNLVGMKAHALLSRLTGRQAHFSSFSTRKLLRYMKQLQPDVVHLHNLHGNYIHFPMLLKYLARQDIPTVVTLHDCWFYTGKCCFYTMDACQRWQGGCGNCPRLRKDNVSWGIDVTADLWAEKKRLFEALPRLAVSGVSDWIMAEAEKSLLACAKARVRIYNWVDLQIFSPEAADPMWKQEMGLMGKKIVLGVASRWEKRKGMECFFELASAFGDAYAVVLVGRPPKNTQLPVNIVHISTVGSTAEMAKIYATSDVFVTFSLEESFGKVSAEALACGTPVVCYDSTANKELVGPNCGAVHAPGDLAAIEASVRKLCAEGKEAHVETCRRFAEANFNKEDRIRDYLDLYERIQNQIGE